MSTTKSIPTRSGLYARAKSEPVRVLSWRKREGIPEFLSPEQVRESRQGPEPELRPDGRRTRRVTS